MRRGFALWVLTKFAMIFFIFALAALMLSLTGAQQTSACDTQAQNAVNSISAKVSQVLYSPSEDERQAYAFTSVLPLGEGGSKYLLNVSYRERPGAAGATTAYLSLYLQSFSGCSGGNSVSLGRVGEYAVVFVTPGGAKKAEAGNALKDSLQFSPSATYARDGSPRSTYLVIVKCAEKRPGGKKYLFVEDCRKDTLSDCNQLAFGGAIEYCCGWNSDAAQCNSVIGA